MATLVSTRDPYLHEQAGEATGFGLLRALEALENAPKAVGSPYTLSEATEALPPPGSLGPAGMVPAALKWGGAFSPLLMARLRNILRVAPELRGKITPAMEAHAVRSLGRDLINFLRRERNMPIDVSEVPGLSDTAIFRRQARPGDEWRGFIDVRPDTKNLPPLSILQHETQHAGYYGPTQLYKQFESGVADTLRMKEPSAASEWAKRMGYEGHPEYAAGELIAMSGDPHVTPGTALYEAFQQPPEGVMRTVRHLKRGARKELGGKGFAKLQGPQEVKGFSAQLPSLIAENHARFGGSSLNQAGESLYGKPGYAVSVVKNAEEVLDHSPTPDEITAYLTKHKATLDKNPDLFVGTWADNGKHYLDISQHVASRDEAMRLGRLHKQKAIFDLERGEAENVPIRLSRYMSRQPGEYLDPTDPNARAGLRSGAELKRIMQGGAPDRLYYYDLSAGEPEYGIKGGRYMAETEIDPSRVYNLVEDPLKFREKHRGANAIENAIRQAGYAGYYTPDPEMSGGLPHVYAMFERMPVMKTQDQWLGARR